MRILTVAPFVVGAFLLAGCGPTTFTKTRMVWNPYDANESKQEKQGIVVELKDNATLPAVFFTSIQQCNENGELKINSLTKDPEVEKVSYAAPGEVWQQVAITNNTNHVIRLSGVAIRLFTPDGSQLEPLSRDDLNQKFLASQNNCPTATVALTRFTSIKVLNRDMEIVPGTTLTDYVAFAPTSATVPGTWKFAFYDIPVDVDDAGKVTKTTKFEIRYNLKSYIDTYQGKNMFDPDPKMIDTKEVTQ